MTKMTAVELDAFLKREFPQMDGYDLRIEVVRDKYVRVRMPFHDRHLRPGGTIAGPAMMALADCASYLAILAMVGPVTQAATVNLNANFLSRPEPKDLIAEADLKRAGRQLAYCDVRIVSDGAPNPVAQITATYAIPRSDGV